MDICCIWILCRYLIGELITAAPSYIYPTKYSRLRPHSLKPLRIFLAIVSASRLVSFTKPRNSSRTSHLLLTKRAQIVSGSTSEQSWVSFANTLHYFGISWTIFALILFSHKDIIWFYIWGDEYFALVCANFKCCARSSSVLAFQWRKQLKLPSSSFWSRSQCLLNAMHLCPKAMTRSILDKIPFHHYTRERSGKTTLYTNPN